MPGLREGSFAGVVGALQRFKIRVCAIDGFRIDESRNASRGTPYESPDLAVHGKPHLPLLMLNQTLSLKLQTLNQAYMP